jgi:hypothetical protein
MQPEEIYHEGEEGARRPGIGSIFYSFVFLASRSSPWCAFVVTIPIPSSFVYPVV